MSRSTDSHGVPQQKEGQQKEGLCRAAWLLVERGAWTEAMAKPVLDDLGLSRPHRERPNSQ